MNTHDRQRHEGQRRIRRRTGIGITGEVAGQWYEGRRWAHAWLCRHWGPARTMALLDAEWQAWSAWVKRQEKHRRHNDYLCWKAARTARHRQQNS